MSAISNCYLAFSQFEIVNSQFEIVNSQFEIVYSQFEIEKLRCPANRFSTERYAFVAFKALNHNYFVTTFAVLSLHLVSYLTLYNKQDVRANIRTLPTIEYQI